MFLLLNIFPNKCPGSLEEKIKKYKMENEERKLSNMGQILKRFTRSSHQA